MLTMPAYGVFEAQRIDILTEASTQNQVHNVQRLTNEQFHELAMKDVEPEDAIIISTKERYNSYIYWLKKEKKESERVVRLSKKKLNTVSMREQLVLLLRRFHPWKEDLDKFILRIEESGFFEAWGITPLLSDVTVNPNLERYKYSEELDLTISTFIPFIIYWAVALSIAIVTFVAEYGYPAITKESRFQKRMPHLSTRRKLKIKFQAGILFGVIIGIILSYYYFKEEDKFPAVIGMLFFQCLLIVVVVLLLPLVIVVVGVTKFKK